MMNDIPGYIRRHDYISTCVCAARVLHYYHHHLCSDIVVELFDIMTSYCYSVMHQCLDFVTSNKRTHA